MITASELRAILSYDKATGLFVWLAPPSRGKSHVGEIAGTLSGGRINIGIGGKPYKAHRLAWLYVHGEWPAMRIDHVDGDPSNNAIANLRLATQSQNCGNARRRKDNTSGFKGVHLCPTTGRWRAQIKCGPTVHRLGRFDTPEEAHAAYVAAATRLFGEFARAA